MEFCPTCRNMLQFELSPYVCYLESRRVKMKRKQHLVKKISEPIISDDDMKNAAQTEMINPKKKAATQRGAFFLFFWGFGCVKTKLFLISYKPTIACFLIRRIRSKSLESGSMANLYVKAVPPADLNRNTEWFTYPGVWTTYILILLFSWLLVISIFGCSPGMAWTIVNLSHSAVTYQFFHWKKGTPFADDQGMYNQLTWWEQMDNGKQLTRNRKFLTVVPLVLYLIASHASDYQHTMLFFNTLAVLVLVVAKFPNMHKVRIFGINSDK